MVIYISKERNYLNKQMWIILLETKLGQKKNCYGATFGRVIASGFRNKQVLRDNS